MAQDSGTIRDFARVAFDPSIPDIQQRVYEGLTEAYLLGLHEGQRFAAQDVLEHVKKAFGITGLPEALIVESLKRLGDKGYLENDKGAWIARSIPMRTTTDTDHFMVMLEELMARVVKKTGYVDGYQRVVIERSLERVLYALLDDSGNEVARILEGSGPSTSSPANLDKTVKDTFAGFKDAELGDSDKVRDAMIESLREMIERPTPAFSEAIWRIGSAYVSLKILAADPQLSKLRRDAFRGGLLILDTNIILDLICEGCAVHDASRALLKSCMTLGYGILIQKSTEDELNRTISKDTLRFKAQKAGYLDPAFATRDIPKTYYENRSKFMDWYAYVAHLKASYSHLLSEFRIERRDFRETLLDPGDIAKASHLVTTQPSLLEKVKDRDAVEHDAESLVAIQDLKMDSSSVLGGPWFLTRDNRVIKASEEYARWKRVQPQAAISYQTLLQLIAPFLSGFVAEKEVIEAFSKILRARIVALPEENVRAFVTYSFEQAGVEYDEELMVSVVAEAHSSRTFQRALGELRIPELLSEITRAVEKASGDAIAIKRKDLALQRLLSAIKGSQKSDTVGHLTISSGLVRLVDDVTNKLRINVHAIGTPSRELEIHNAMETMLATLDYDFNRAKDSHGFSTVGTVPDFTVQANQVKIPLEIKFVDSKGKIPQIIEEMAADQTKYHKKYDSIIFVVYDFGHISDIVKFSKDFEDQGDVVLVVKH